MEITDNNLTLSLFLSFSFGLILYFVHITGASPHVLQHQTIANHSINCFYFQEVFRCFLSYVFRNQEALCCCESVSMAWKCCHHLKIKILALFLRTSYDHTLRFVRIRSHLLIFLSVTSSCHYCFSNLRLSLRYFLT